MSEVNRYLNAEQLMPEPQLYPGRESEMKPRPVSDLSNYRAADKLKGKVALITGGDSGMGRAVAIAFAMEGAAVAIAYNISNEDAKDTAQIIEKNNQRCLFIKADISRSDECRRVIAQTVEQRRSGQPEEIASTYVYLVASDSSFTSGSLIEVTGGWIGW